MLLRKSLVFFVLFFLALVPAISQSYYETAWTTSSGSQYKGLLVFYDENEAFMRVSYYSRGEDRIAEFKCRGEYYTAANGNTGYDLDGYDARMIIGSSTASYSADNFVFLSDDEGNYSLPYVIDDNALASANPDALKKQVDAWSEISTDKFTPDYVGTFFTKDEAL